MSIVTLPRCFGHEHRRCSRRLDQGRLEHLAAGAKISVGNLPPKRSAISWILSGRNVPSVSPQVRNDLINIVIDLPMYATFPSAPPITCKYCQHAEKRIREVWPPLALGSWAMTAMVCASWVLPHPGGHQLRSKIEKFARRTELSIDLVDAHCLKSTAANQRLSNFCRCPTYPFKAASSCLLPVDILMHRLRTSRSSAAVMKPVVLGCALSKLCIRHIHYETY